ncbi:MAG: hypothetical protein SGI83_13310 [Bacteroidota bacterium]|nr:hypothetical protein [Bacteroidota bacterium]
MKKMQSSLLFTALLLVILSATLLPGCKGKKTEDKANTEKSAVSPAVTADTTTQMQPAIAAPPPPAPTVSLPIFEQTREEIEKYYGTSRKNPKKFIIRLEFADLTNPNSQNSKLLLYPADTHKEYGKNQEPLEIPATASTVVISSSVIIGNNEFDGNKKLLTTPGNGNTLKPFSVIRFTPVLVTGSDNRTNHLSYTVELVSPDKSTAPLGDTKPSPPAPPEY